MLQFMGSQRVRNDLVTKQQETYFPQRKAQVQTVSLAKFASFLRKNYQYFTNSSKNAAAAKSLQSCLTLCDPIDGSPPGSPIPGILQARTLEWVAISFSNAWKWQWKWSHSVVSDSSDPMDCSLPGSSIHGIFQARILEWGAIAFSASKNRKGITTA